MGNKLCGAEPAILTPGGNDLSPCFEFALRDISFLYMLLLAIFSVGPIKRTPVVPAAAAFAHRRADFLLAAFAALQSLVWLILDFALADKRPDAFPAAPIFRLTTLLSLCAWSTSCVLILTTARRALRMPALHIAFWWAVLVFDAKRIETGVLRVVRTDSIATAWDSVAALIEFATVLALLLWHRCCSDDPRGSVLSGSDGGDEVADFYDTQYNLENYQQVGDQSLFSIDASPFATRTRSESQSQEEPSSHSWQKLFSFSSGNAYDELSSSSKLDTDNAPPHSSYSAPSLNVSAPQARPTSRLSRALSPTAREISASASASTAAASAYNPLPPLGPPLASKSASARAPLEIDELPADGSAPRSELPVHLTVPTVTEGTVLGRTVLQFSIRVQSQVLPLPVGGYSVWRTLADFQLLQKQCSAIFRPRRIARRADAAAASESDSVGSISQCPALPPSMNAIMSESSDVVRALLHNFLGQLLLEPSLAQPLAAFCDLDKHVNKARSAPSSFVDESPILRAAAQQQQQQPQTAFSPAQLIGDWHRLRSSSSDANDSVTNGSVNRAAAVAMGSTPTATTPGSFTNGWFFSSQSDAVRTAVASVDAALADPTIASIAAYVPIPETAAVAYSAEHDATLAPTRPRTMVVGGTTAAETAVTSPESTRVVPVSTLRSNEADMTAVLNLFGGNSEFFAGEDFVGGGGNGGNGGGQAGDTVDPAEPAAVVVNRLVPLQGSALAQHTDHRRRGFLMLSVIGWMRWQPVSKGSEYATFTVALRTHRRSDNDGRGDVDGSSSAVVERCVRRRYSEFFALFEALTALHGELVPALPAPSAGFFGLGSQMSPEFLDKRRRLLEAWLQRLVNTSHFHGALLHDFLSPKDQQCAPAASAAGYSARDALPLPDAPLDENGIAHAVVAASEHANVFGDPAWGSHFFECEFARWGVAHDAADGAEHAVHTFVMREFYSRSEFISWHITKRYSDFRKLHDELVKASADVPTPALPPKIQDPIAARNAAQIVERCRRLELFLQQLCNTGAFQLEPFFQFIELNNPGRDITTGARGA